MYKLCKGEIFIIVVYLAFQAEFSRPLGFDLEWRVMWHPGAQERRTALVQLCDHETILLIQVSSMKSMRSRSFALRTFQLTFCERIPQESYGQSLYAFLISSLSADTRIGGDRIRRHRENRRQYPA